MTKEDLEKLDVSQIKEIASKDILADLIQQTSTQEGQQRILDLVRNQSDEALKEMAILCGIPPNLHDTFIKMTKDENNDFISEFDAIKVQPQSGDILMIQGESKSSKFLSAIQRPTYFKARSSHIALIHADFMCIDAMPKSGVRHVTLPDILPNDLSRFKIMRLKSLTSDDIQSLMSNLGYFLEQPYKISPSRAPAKNFSYCSELARKIYKMSKIKKTGIHNGIIISPADFDKLLDNSKEWEDITDQLMPYIDFCVKYGPIINNISKHFTTGFKLNKQRYLERKEYKRSVRKDDRLSPESKKKILDKIEKFENGLHHKFWDIDQMTK